MSSTPPGLGPHCVGQRVVVRRVLPGLTGPSGGPAMTDLLGVVETWTDTAVRVRAEDGTVTEIALRDIVSGKPVPPRPSPRTRLSAERACRLTNASWPAMHVEPLGDWLLRASDGFSARANSVMAVGSPGIPFDAALERVRGFYARHELPPWAQVVVGSEPADRFGDAGWVTARPGEADSLLQLAPVAQASRTVRRLTPRESPPVVVRPVADPAWLASDQRALAHPEAARAVLEGPTRVGFVSVTREGEGSPIAKGRVAGGGPVSGPDASAGPEDQDWAGITDVWVSPDARRQGLGLVVLAALLDWAAEHGATTVYLQVRADNVPGLALYERLGFRTHHTYRYLAAPG